MPQAKKTPLCLDQQQLSAHSMEMATLQPFLVSDNTGQRNDEVLLVQFSAGSRLDDRLFAALTSLSGGGSKGQWYATEALAKRCEEVTWAFSHHTAPNQSQAARYLWTIADICDARMQLFEGC